MSLMSPALAGGFFTTSVTWEAISAVDIFLFKIFFFNLAVLGVRSHDMWDL